MSLGIVPVLVPPRGMGDMKQSTSMQQAFETDDPNCDFERVPNQSRETNLDQLGVDSFSK